MGKKTLTIILFTGVRCENGLPMVVESFLRVQKSAVVVIGWAATRGLLLS